MNSEGYVRTTVAGSHDWLRKFLLTVGFGIFLVPLTIDGNSVNYAFVLVPLLSAVLVGRVQVPPRSLQFAILFYVFVFIVAVAYQFELIDELTRRLVSFVLFMSVFSFMFVKLDGTMVLAFKSALVIAGIFFAMLSVGTYFALGGSELGFEAKDAVGGQWYGFIYILAFWLVFLSQPKSSWLRLLKRAATLVLVVGLTLTFSRASVVAFSVSFVAYAVWAVRKDMRHSLARGLGRIAAVAVGLLAAVTVLAFFFPFGLEFFGVRLVEFLTDSEGLQDNLADADTSEGTRIFIWRNILEYVISNPLTGSGFLGVWILRLFDEMSGSAHNQYFDVLFRVGLAGFLIYVFLLYRVGRFLARSHRDLFWGFIGVIVYGFFHETFKESHGGFVLAFLLGMMSQSGRTSAKGHDARSREIRE